MDGIDAPMDTDDACTPQTGIKSSFCDSNTIARVLFLLAMFFLTTLTPALRIENSFLMQAFAVRGVKLPDRKQLYAKHLEDCYGHYRDIFLAELAEFNGTYQIATDGWKKKAAERGTFLIMITGAITDTAHSCMPPSYCTSKSN